MTSTSNIGELFKMWNTLNHNILVNNKMLEAILCCYMSPPKYSKCICPFGFYVLCILSFPYLYSKWCIEQSHYLHKHLYHFTPPGPLIYKWFHFLLFYSFLCKQLHQHNERTQKIIRRSRVEDVSVQLCQRSLNTFILPTSTTCVKMVISRGE